LNLILKFPFYHLINNMILIKNMLKEWKNAKFLIKIHAKS